VTTTVLNRVGHPVRRAKLRHYLMCPPTYFDVAYSINGWMDPSGHVDGLAVRQWSGLVDAYRSTGHRVDLLQPLAGLSDMVFAANGATVVDGCTLPARFANTEREAEATAAARLRRSSHGASFLTTHPDKRQEQHGDHHGPHSYAGQPLARARG
jgi:N-dimethylarginine dimethylaminohydrolase